MTVKINQISPEEKTKIKQAWKDGKKIQIKGEDWEDWYSDSEPNWLWEFFEYRVKPEY